MILEVDKFIKEVQNDPNILGRMQRIPDGDYTGKLALVDDQPVCEVVEIPTTEFKRAFVRMNLKHDSNGNKEKNVEVGYNSSLLPILEDEKHWTQTFCAKTTERVSQRTNNPYQVVQFNGLEEE